MSNSNFTLVADLSTEDIKSKIEKTKLYLDLLQEELLKRKKSTIKTVVSKSLIKPKKVKGEIVSTIKDMKTILERKNISYKASSTKAELEDLIRKNNLIRFAETHTELRKNNKT